MIWIRFIIFIFTILYVIYYIHLIAQLLGMTTFTYRKITFVRCIIPFYYWISDPNKIN